MEESKKKEFDPQWCAFKKGDKKAFSSIYKAHIHDLLNYGYKVTSDRKLIEDSIQDLFLELWQNRERLSETTSIRFYLFKALRYKIVRNTDVKQLIGIEHLDTGSNQLNSFSHESYLIELEVQSAQVSQLRDLIHKLPQRQQEAINLRYYHYFSNEEVAQIMGVNYQSACKFIYTALRTLKRNMPASAKYHV